MNTMEARVITKEHSEDILLKNDPFPLNGKMIVSYVNQKWGYTVERFPPDQCSEMRFPDEAYDFDAMSKDTVFIGAYDGDQCVGLVLLQKAFFKYMYIPDFKVSAACRGQGVGRMLVQKAAEAAKEMGYRGLYLQGQDNNLNACLFYIHTGFRIGGLDTEVYKGTSQEGKADIMFYLDV